VIKSGSVLETAVLCVSSKLLALICVIFEVTSNIHIQHANTDTTLVVRLDMLLIHNFILQLYANSYYAKMTYVLKLGMIWEIAIFEFAWHIKWQLIVHY
jgi:hypothetical protein